MSFNLNDFLHKPQLPAWATPEYYRVVNDCVPYQNPPGSLLRTVDQLAKGMVFDLYEFFAESEGAPPLEGYLNLCKAGSTSTSPYIPYALVFKDKSTGAAQLTGTYNPFYDNILPSSINRALTEFHQKIKFDVDLVNNHTVKQVALIDLRIPFKAGLSLEESVRLFRDTYAVFIQYPQLHDLYYQMGFSGSQIITSVTTNAHQSWNVSAKLMLVMNAFSNDPLLTELQAQEFADIVTKIWVHAIAHVNDIEDLEDLQNLGDLVSKQFINFTFHCHAENVISATPNVNYQLYGFENFLQENADKIKALTAKDIVNDSLQLPEAGEITPCQLLRLAKNENVSQEISQWAVNKWVEYCAHFMYSDQSILPDPLYLKNFEYDRELWENDIAQARQDYFYALNRDNANNLMIKIPINLFYTMVNPCVLQTTILNLAERKPGALSFFMQMLLDLHNEILYKVIDQEKFEEDGLVSQYLPPEWLYLSQLISDDLIELGIILINQEKINFDDPAIEEIQTRLAFRIESWENNNFYRSQLVSGEVGLDSRHKMFCNTYIVYERYNLRFDVLCTEPERARPTALLAANVYNLVFDETSAIAQALGEQSNNTLSPEAYARAQAEQKGLEKASDYAQNELPSIEELEEMKDQLAKQKAEEENAEKAKIAITDVNPQAEKASDKDAKAKDTKSKNTKSKNSKTKGSKSKITDNNPLTQAKADSESQLDLREDAKAEKVEDYGLSEDDLDIKVEALADADLDDLAFELDDEEFK